MQRVSPQQLIRLNLPIAAPTRGRTLGFYTGTEMNLSLTPASNVTKTFVIRDFFRSARSTCWVLALALLPWICVATFAAGSWAALNLIAFAILAFLAGYAVVSAALPADARGYAAVLAPSAGILVLSALTPFWLRLGLPLVLVSFVWLGLAAAGTIVAWGERRQLEKATVEYGAALVFLSVLICALYFIPGAFNDAVVRHDGGFSWSSIDTQYYHSMVESIRISVGQPKMPGTFTADLYYHLGPYAVAAAISAFGRISTGDALIRVTRGVEQWALIFSCLGVGTFLSLKATAKTFGGPLSVAALFFYGSFLSLFSGVVTPHPVAPWPILFESGGQFPTNGGPFSHIFLGVSVLHGLEAITAIMALCILQRDEGITNPWRILTALTLPALAVAVNLPAAGYCLVVVAILLFWGHLTSFRSWLYMAIMLVLFVGAYWLIGYGRAPHIAGGIQLSRLPAYWWTFVMWFAVALGIRVISLAWLNQGANDPLAVLVLVSFVGLLMFSWLGAFWMENGKYGVYYLQAMFSILAFSRLPGSFLRRDERGKWITEWLSLEKRGLIVFAVVGVLIGMFGYLIHGSSDINHFRERIPVCVVVILICAILSAVMHRKQRLSAAVSAVIAAVLLVGFLGWIPPWLKYRTGGHSYNVSLAPGEVRGLKRLHDLAAGSDRFATNKHALTGGSEESEGNSYGYETLSGLPVLLEGFHDGAEENIHDFATLLHENDILFTTTNPDVLRDIAQSYRVRWLVARPGTDISLPKPLPAWLVEQPDSGSLKIYRIN